MKAKEKKKSSVATAATFSNSFINVNLVRPIYFADKESNAQIISVICHRMSQLQRSTFSSFLITVLRFSHKSCLSCFCTVMSLPRRNTDSLVWGFLYLLLLCGGFF